MKFLVLFVVAFSALVSVSPMVLNVPGYGTLNGTDEKSADAGRPYYAFRGVFYAEKPTPEYRFLPPEPKRPYPEGEVVQAVRNNLGCLQGGNGLGEEDCLSLNVFTPKIPTSDSDTLPVMFWIHGGSFRSGQAIEYIPDRFMDYDIVLVVVQYRLGPLGFMSLNTDEIPGNAGIFDAIEALRWVKAHIKTFGGNPDEITIAGESSGSATVSILLQAPQAQGMFKRAIGESGSVLAEWALDRYDGYQPSMRVAEIAGCPLTPYEDLLNCLRTIPGEDLTKAFSIYNKEDLKNGGLGFSPSNPVIQKAGKQRVIERDPKETFASGNYSAVPIMFGCNKQEGTLVLAYAYKDFLVPNNLTEDSAYLANDLIPMITNSLHIVDNTGVLTDALIDKYFVGAEMGNFESMTPGLIDMMGVLYLKSAGYEMVRLNSMHAPSYWYSFNFLGRNSLFTYIFLGNDIPFDHGVSHADEMIYLYVYPFPSLPPGLNATEKLVSKRMLEVWTNFVIHGEPTPDGLPTVGGIPKFPPYNRGDNMYMAIDTEWELRKDYTKTYTVTVDELNGGAQTHQDDRPIPDRFNNRHHLLKKGTYLDYVGLP